MAVIDQYAEQAKKVNTKFQPKVNKKDLETFMRANWGKVTLKAIADKFSISEITVKRYAREFKLVRIRELLKVPLKTNQRLTALGVLTITGAVTRHESR